jgi:pimeloyl-ACP methyl ester carboxylesterase
MSSLESETTISWLHRENLPRIAYCKTAGAEPGVVFFGGFASDMTGTKAMALEAAAVARGRAFLRFDYRGHGQSDGVFAASTIGDWLGDALAAFDMLTQGPQILIGSSMGGWIALKLATLRAERVKSLIGIAAAPDFTERLIWQKLPVAARTALLSEGVLYPPSAYGDTVPITLKLIEEGRAHLMLDRPIPIASKVRLLHGQRDPEVPWELSLEIAQKIESTDVRVMLIKDGDHRLSRPQDIALLIATLNELIDATE